VSGDLEGLVKERALLRAAGKRVVFANGCFDILHAGHLDLLERARSLGDMLIVAINSDRSVRALKGEGRPIVPEAERAEALLALEAVDRVLIYDDETPARLIDALVPDVLVKGADWGEGEIVGRGTVEGAGGQAVRVPLLAGRSTSSLVDRIRKP
jgi:D-beta-D-heptose 7-phosphate kinase/D-beta-D-heptose 1-phosphate adenosyltransferase